MRIWGEEVEYKGIKIYPVKVKDAEFFYDNIKCLLFEKNRIPDIRVIKLSYLDFLFALISEQHELFDNLNNILKLVFKEQKYEFTFNNGCIGLIVNGIEIGNYEFDNIKKIIFDENLIQVSDELLDPELEKSLQEAEEFMSQKNGKPATFEERIIALHCVSGTSLNEIKEYTIYQFSKILERHAIIKNFDTYAAVLAQNGASDSITNWLVHIEEKGRYADVTMSKDEFDKIANDVTSAPMA
jgi:hypothetical protein